jgi:hypothetical protein
MCDAQNLLSYGFKAYEIKNWRAWKDKYLEASLTSYFVQLDSSLSSSSKKTFNKFFIVLS